MNFEFAYFKYRYIDALDKFILTNQITDDHSIRPLPVKPSFN